MFKTLQATVNNFDMDELFPADPWTRKKNEQVKTEFDLLVLSAALYRLRKVASKDTSMNHIHTMSLTDTQLPKYVTPEDYDFAETIKEHFGQKLFVLKLKNTNLTNFREDLNSFLHSNWHTDTSGVFIYPERFLGLAYKLPYLYDYDMQMKEVFDSDYCDIKGPNALRDEKSLTHIKTIVQNRKHNNNTEYWFSDEKNNRVMILVEKHNPLKSVFDYLVQEPIKVKGKFEMRMKDSQHYYSTPVWEVVI
jgi:hypothetical protein